LTGKVGFQSAINWLQWLVEIIILYIHMGFSIFSPSDEFRFNRAWSKPHYHLLKDQLDIYNASDGTVNSRLKVGKQLKIGGVPDSPGVYLIQDEFGKYRLENIYCGKSEGKKTSGIRSRLTSHFRGTGTRGLEKDVLYTIRWAKSDRPGIAEALMVIFFQPKANIAKDWVSALKETLQSTEPQAMLQEARRLGFCEKPYGDAFMGRLITQCRKL